MAKEKKKQETDPQAWMFSFSDLLTNMLTFFVLLYSMGSMDNLTFEYVVGPSLRGALGIINQGGLTSIGKPRFMPISVPPTEEFALIEDAVVKALLSRGDDQSKDKSMPVSDKSQTIDIYANSKFAQILFPAQILFEKNSAEILPQMARHLEGIAELLKKFAHPVRINGYSHSASLGGSGASLEVLSLKRASAVLQFFISRGGLAPERCSIAGYGGLRHEERNGKSEDYVEVFIIKAINYPI
ncbi:MAG: flagellar motor protein MotB [bacterium]